jgi:uncharacterized protein
MRGQYWRSAACVAAITVVFGLMAAVSRAQTIQVSQANKTIAVTATDKATADSDVAIITVGFLVFAPDSASAYEKGSQLSNSILDALKKAGVPDKAIESQNQSLGRTEFPDGDKSTPEERKQRQFNISQSWTVKAPAKDAAGVLHTAIEAGANESGHIDWDLTDHGALQAKAAEKALVHAREIAKQMASGLNAHLGSLVYASNQMPMQRFAAGVLNSAMATVSVSAEPKQEVPLAIKPQQVEESATVYAVFAIE